MNYSIDNIYIEDDLCTWCLLRFGFTDVFDERKFEFLYMYHANRFILTYMVLSIDSKYNRIVVWKSTTRIDHILFLYYICTFLHFKKIHRLVHLK